MNCVVLMGRLTKDPEIRGDESKVAKYTLAVDRRFSKDNEVDFIPVTVFGKGVEFTEKYLKKGIKIVVRGRIQTGSYTNKDGQKVYTTDVVAEEQEFAESKNNSSAPANGNDGDFMDVSKFDSSDMPF